MENGKRDRRKSFMKDRPSDFPELLLSTAVDDASVGAPDETE